MQTNQRYHNLTVKNFNRKKEIVEIVWLPVRFGGFENVTIGDWPEGWEWDAEHK